MTLTTGAKRVAIIVFCAIQAATMVSALGGSANAADRARSARAHTEAARAYFNLEKYREAIGEFEQAYLDKHDPATFFEIAECHRQLGNVAEAQRFYKRFLQDAPRGHANRAAAEVHSAEMAAAVERAESDRQAAAASSAGTAGGSRPLPPSFPPSSRYLAPLPSSGGTAPVAPAPPAAPGREGSAPPAQPAPASPSPPVGDAGATRATFVSAAPNPEPVAGPATLVMAPASQPSSSSQPIYARWWFWTLVGGVVVGGVVAGLVVASSSPSRPSCPVGVSCQ